jgi:hypothetical protein
VFYEGGNSYVPLRTCTVVRALDYGDVVFFELVMGPLVDYRDGRYDAYSKVLSDQLYGGKAWEEVKKLVFNSNKLGIHLKLDDESSAAQSRKIWTKTISQLGCLEQLKDVAFFKFALFHGNREVKPSFLGAAGFGYGITSGEAYKFDVFEYVGGLEQSERLGEPFDFEMQNDTTLLAPLSAKQRIDGVYDRFELSFRAAPLLTGTNTMMILNEQQKIGNTVVPMTYLPAAIRNSLWKRSVAYLGIPLCIVFFLLPSLARTIATRLSQWSRFDLLLGSWSVTDEMIQGLAVIVFVGIIANWDFASFVSTLREKIKF